MKIVWRDGNFLIEDIRKVYQVGPYLTSHNCGHRTDSPNWKPFAFHPNAVGRACRECGEHAPDGLQAVFWFLNEDHSE